MPKNSGMDRLNSHSSTWKWWATTFAGPGLQIRGNITASHSVILIPVITSFALVFHQWRITTKLWLHQFGHIDLSFILINFHFFEKILVNKYIRVNFSNEEGNGIKFRMGPCCKNEWGRCLIWHIFFKALYRHLLRAISVRIQTQSTPFSWFVSLLWRAIEYTPALTRQGTLSLLCTGRRKEEETEEFNCIKSRSDHF